MARKKISVKQVAKDLLPGIKTNVRVDKVLVFGSQARGTADNNSDYDFIVLSRDFERWPTMKRLVMLNRSREGAALDVSMDILGFTPQEFKKFKFSPSPNLRQIYREAKKIA